jgi:formate dehydrogenase accessory protein FdhE
MNPRRWDVQIRRAEHLLVRYDFAAEALRFFRTLTQFQKSLYEEIETARAKEPRPSPGNGFAEAPDFFHLLPRFPAFLSLIVGNAPSALAEFAGQMSAQSTDRSRATLEEYWFSAGGVETDSKRAEMLLAWVFLQPYAVSLAEDRVIQDAGEAPSVCPVCLRKPLAGVLRSEGDGAKRSLVCMLCGQEWNFRRIVCPACGEEDVHKLAVYTADEFAHVRVEACDTCGRYIKTVDLTKDGHAVPAVDEITTIPLNLWAAEHGYTKLQTNLLGI